MKPTHRSRAAFAAAVLVTLSAFVGCGGSDDNPTPTSATPRTSSMPHEMAQPELDGPIETVGTTHAAKRALGKALGRVEEHTNDRNAPAKNGASKPGSHETGRLVKDLLEGDRTQVASSKKEMQKAIDELRDSVTAPSSQDGVESQQQDQPRQQGQGSVEAIINEALRGSGPGP